MLLQSQLPHGGLAADLLPGAGCSPVQCCLVQYCTYGIVKHISVVLPTCISNRLTESQRVQIHYHTAPSRAQSDLDLHCLLNNFRTNVKGH